MRDPTDIVSSSPATRTFAVAATILAVPGGLFLILDQVYGRTIFASIIPSYHGPLLLGVSVLAAVVLWFALSGLRTAEDSLQRMRIAQLKARLQIEISERLIAGADSPDGSFEGEIPALLEGRSDKLSTAQAGVRSPRAEYRERNPDGE